MYKNKNISRFIVAYLCLLVIILVSSSAYAGELIRVIEGTVTKVSDGDTLTVVTNDGTKVKVRLAGVDTCETVKYNKSGVMTKSGQPYGDEAKKFTEQLVGNKFVRVYVYGIDQYKRVLGFVDVKEANLNLELVRAGLAEVYIGGEYGPFKKGLMEAERDAKDKGKGMWSLGDKYESPRDFRRRLKVRGE